MHRTKLVVIAMLMAGCDTLTGGTFAQAGLVNLNDSRVWGRVTFHETDGKTLVGNFLGRPAPVAQSLAADAGIVFVRFDLNNLPPNRQFSFAVHDRGDCSAEGAKIGGYFNPGGRATVRSGSEASPGVSMPPIVSNGEGTAMASFETTEFTVAAGPRSIVNRSVVVREMPDAFLSLPGARPGALIACGIIKVNS